MIIIPAFNRAKSQGFTLIEVLVVIIIIAIIITVAVLALGDLGKSRAPRREAFQLAQLIPYASQQALLHPTQLGIYFSRDSYQFFQYHQYYDHNNKLHTRWQPYPNTSVLGLHKLPSGIFFALKVSNESIDLSAATNNQTTTTNVKTPQVLLFSSGNMTPFVLAIGTTNQPQNIQLIGKSNGEIEQRSKQG